MIDSTLLIVLPYESKCKYLRFMAAHMPKNRYCTENNPIQSLKNIFLYQ